MAIGLALSAVAETTATFTLTGQAGSGTIDVQVSSDPRFGFCVCPIFSMPRGSPMTVAGLNQRATLFARMRNRATDGTVDDWSNVVPFRTSDGAAQNTAPGNVLIDLALVVLPMRGVTWSGGATLTAFPADNLGYDSPVAWRTGDTAANTRYLDADLPGAPWDTLALLNTNLPEAATVTVTAYTSAANRTSNTGGVIRVNALPFRASPNLPGRKGYHGLFRLGAPVTDRFIRIQIAGAVTGSITHVEHAVIGLNRVTKNHSVDKTEEPMARGSVDRSRSGVPDRIDGLVMRKVEFDISMLTEAQFETAYSDLIYYENEAVLVAPNSKSGAFLHDRLLYGDLKGSRIYNPFSPRFTRTFGIESLI